MNDTSFLMALHSLNKLSAEKILTLLDVYGDAETTWRNHRDWGKVLKLAPSLAEELNHLIGQCDVDELYAKYLASGTGIVCLGDSAYPRLLADIHDPPFLLYYKGNLPAEDEICLAMIGSRNLTGYGRQVAELLGRDLARKGFTIVSGMARGIDGVCHRAALNANGRTVAVLGSGADVVYPRENKQLYEDICDSGAIISEFPLGSPALPKHFPRRNRIISGISVGIIVIEAGPRSGTLLTVDYGLEQGKDIFAVPGPITSEYSKGPNRLIKQGARIVINADDICEEYERFSDNLAKYVPQLKKTVGTKTHNDNNETNKQLISAEERNLLSLMILPIHFDDLAEQCHLDSSRLAATLTILEIRGLARQLPGRYYQAVVKKI